MCQPGGSLTIDVLAPVSGSSARIAAYSPGVVWKPKERDYRLAVSGGLPVYTGELQYDCDPLNCYGYILPSGAVVPWDMTLGAGWRFGIDGPGISDDVSSLQHLP